MRVIVVIGEVRILRLGIEGDIGAGVGGLLPGLLRGEADGAEDFGRGGGFGGWGAMALADGRWRRRAYRFRDCFQSVAFRERERAASIYRPL